MRFLLVILFGAVSAVAQINTDWNPPASIPRPSFGITNTIDMYRPEYGLTYAFTDGRGTIAYPTNEHGPYTHYVDKTHASARDGTNTFGTPTVPRLTWPNPANTPAGSVIQIAGVGLANAYNFNNSSPGSKLGMGSDTATANLPVFYTGTGLSARDCVSNFEAMLTNKTATLDTNAMYALASTGMVWISASEMVPYGNYTIIENLASTNGNWNIRTTLKGSGVRYVAIRDCFGVGNSGSGSGSWLSIGGSESTTTQFTDNILAWRCIASRFGQWNPGTGSQSDDRTMLIADGVATNLWFLDSIGFEMGGDTARLGANLGDPKLNEFIYMGRVRAFRNAENGVDVKGAKKSIVADCIMHDMSNTAGGTSVIVVHQTDSSPPAPEDIWIINNVVWDTLRTNSRGFVHTGASVGTDIWFIGNEAHDLGQYGFYLDRGGGGIHLLNCTAADFGVNGLLTSGTVDFIRGTNNVFYNITGSGQHLSVSGTSLASDTMFYCAVYEPGGSVSIKWGSPTYSSVAAWIAGTSVGDNSIESDPLFEDTSSNDFRPTSSSPLRNVGASLAGVDAEFKSIFGNDVTILTDRMGVTRGGDGSVDLGAYEYTAGGSITFQSGRSRGGRGGRR